MIFLLFPLITSVLKSNTGKISICVVCLILKFVPGFPEIFLIRRTMYHLVYFAFGYCLKGVIELEDVRNFIQRNRKPSLVAGFFISTGILFLCPLYASMDDNQLLGIPLALMGICGAVIISVLIEEKMIKRHLLGFGKYSLQIYLLNGFLLTITRTLIVNVLHIETPVVIILFNWFVNLVISYYVIKWIFSRFNVTRFFFGIV